MFLPALCSAFVLAIMRNMAGEANAKLGACI